MKGHFVYGILRSARNHFLGFRTPYIIYRNPTCKGLSNNNIKYSCREHPRAGSKQMATYQAVVTQTQSSSSSSNLCCSVATQTWSAHHVACLLLHTIHYVPSMNAVWRTPIQPRPQTALLLLLLYIFSRTRSSSMLAALLSPPLFFPPLSFFH